MSERSAANVRAVFALPRATAPADTDPLWLTAYAYCRGFHGVACACERIVREPCPRVLLGAIEVEKQREAGL